MISNFEYFIFAYYIFNFNLVILFLLGYIN